MSPQFPPASAVQTRRLCTLSRGNGSRITTISFAPNGVLIAGGDSEGRLSVWSLNVS